MAITQNSSEGLISVSGNVLPGNYSYIIVGSEYGEWAYFRPDGSSDYYLIGDGQYVDESSPPPVLAVGVGDAPGRDLTYGTLDIRGSEGAPIVVDVRGFTGFPETDGDPIALFIIGDSGGQGSVYATYASINVDSQIDGQGIENLGKDRSVVLIGDHGDGSLRLSDSKLNVDAGYQASVNLGGQSASDQGSSDLWLWNSDLSVASHRASLAIGGGHGTTLYVGYDSKIFVLSEPVKEYVNDTDGWIDATIKVGVGDAFGRLNSSIGSAISVEGQHAGIEIGVDGYGSYGYAQLNGVVDVFATAGEADWIWNTEGAPQDNFAYVNVGGRPWVKSDRDGDGPGGVGVLLLSNQAQLNLRTWVDYATMPDVNAHSEMNIGGAGGKGFVVMQDGSKLGVETINVGNGNHDSPYEPGYGLFYFDYGASVNANMMVVGDASGVVTAEHAYLRIDTADEYSFGVDNVQVTHGGVLLGDSFRLDREVTINDGGVLRIGDEYESATEFSELEDGRAQDVTGRVVEGAGYLYNYGELRIDGTVVMQASTSADGYYERTRDHISNGGLLVLGGTAQFEVALEADSSYYVGYSEYTDDPALSQGDWGRVLLADDADGNIILSSTASVEVNGVAGDLWLEANGNLWAYFDLSAVFPERDHWVIENQQGTPIAISLENPIDADLLGDVSGYGFSTLEDAAYSALPVVVDESGFGYVEGTADSEVFLVPVGLGFGGPWIFSTGGGNDFVFADGLYDDLAERDGDVLTFSESIESLNWDFSHGSVSSGYWTTLFTGIEVVIGGAGDDTYQLNGGDAVTIEDHLGNNSYALSPDLMEFTQPNWAVNYVRGFGTAASGPEFHRDQWPDGYR
jgi:hypothetical protein